MPSFLYLALRRIFELLVLLCRSGERKELKILALRHELSVLRRRAGRPRYEDRDRVLLAALSGALPRARWSAFAVTPETCCAGIAAWSGAAGPTTAAAPDDLRSARISSPWFCASRARTRAGVTGGSSAN